MKAHCKEKQRPSETTNDNSRNLRQNKSIISRLPARRKEETVRYTEKRRQFTREINFVKQAMFFATAAAFAAGASDMAGNAVAGGLGNFGILLILVRVYFMAPVVIASVRAQDSQWAAEEEAELMRRTPWVHMVGRAGWGLLFASVGLQLLLDVA